MSNGPVTLIVDVSNLVHRAYHATVAREKRVGVPASALTTLSQMLRNVVGEVGEARLIAAFDAGATFRHSLFPGYKSGRAERPEGLTQLMTQVPNWLSEHFGSENLFSPNHEADDVIATVADQCLPYGHRVLILSNDGDLLQLVVGTGPGPGTFILKYDKGAYSSVGARQVEAKLGVPPHRVVMFKSLMGDTGDNYPGCPKLGPVAAKRLALKYGSPKTLWAALPDLQRSDRAALELAGFQHLELMHTLARLNHRATLRTLEVS